MALALMLVPLCGRAWELGLLCMAGLSSAAPAPMLALVCGRAWEPTACVWPDARSRFVRDRVFSGAGSHAGAVVRPGVEARPACGRAWDLGSFVIVSSAALALMRALLCGRAWELGLLCMAGLSSAAPAPMLALVCGRAWEPTACWVCSRCGGSIGW